MRHAVLLAIALVAGLCLTSPAMAQGAAKPVGDTILDRIFSPDRDVNGTLAILLIFGTGFVASALWGLSQVIRAIRGETAASANVRQRVQDLEDRVANIESAVSQPPVQT